MNQIKRFWIKEHKYDWYDSRKKGNLIERNFYERKIRFMLKKVNFSDKTVLDLGCGAGVCTEDIAKASRFAVGADISAWAIARAKKRFPNISFVIADSENLPFRKGAFEIVINTGLIQYLENPYPTVNETKRILKKGGKTIIEVPWKHGPYNSKLLRSVLTSKENPNREPVNRTFTKKELSHIFGDFSKLETKIFFMNVIYGIFERK